MRCARGSNLLLQNNDSLEGKFIHNREGTVDGNSYASNRMTSTDSNKMQC